MLDKGDKMADFKDLPNMDKLNDIMHFNPLQKVMESQQEQILSDLQHARESKEFEELRRHNELITALKSAGEKGATIIVGNNSKDIQIQQNSNYSSQEMANLKPFNYDKAMETLKEIQGYFDFPQFSNTFKENTETVKNIVLKTIEAVEKRNEPSLIHKSLLVIKNLAISASGSLISSGIIAIITSFLAG
jgi:hypothetical protein